MQFPHPYRGIILEGGGVLGMAYVGALQGLQSHGIHLDSITHFVGTSAGSIVAALLAAGYSVEEMEQELYNVEWPKVKDGNPTTLQSMAGFMVSYGRYKGEYLQQLIEMMLYRKTRVHNITFGQLYQRTGKYLGVPVTNVSDRRLERFDSFATRQASVSLAVRISSSVPLVFQAVNYNDKLYVDGGVLRNCDMTALQGTIDWPDKVLALKLEVKEEERGRINTPYDFVQSLFRTMFEHANKYGNEKPENVDILSIETGDISPLNFDLSRDDQARLSMRGVDAVERFFGQKESGSRSGSASASASSRALPPLPPPAYRETYAADPVTSNSVSLAEGVEVVADLGRAISAFWASSKRTER